MTVKVLLITSWLGSSLYEKITLDCTDKDPTYTGEWYCSTIEVQLGSIGVSHSFAVTMRALQLGCLLLLFGSIVS